MNKQELHPELRKAYRFVPAIPIQVPPIRALVTFLQRALPKKVSATPGVAIEDKVLSEGGVRIYAPRKGASGAGLLWIHGGGYVLGDVSINDRECSALARALGLVVVSVDYRLAPGHPFPAALDDCLEAWNLIQRAAEGWGIDRERVAVGGQSAGGGLAAALVQRIADLGGTQPAAQVLIYPMLDDRTAADRERDRAGHVLWNNRNNRAAWGWYLNQPPGQVQVPAYAVPARRENLAGLPPAWVGVGTLDLFHEEDGHYAERLRAAGVPCELYRVPAAPHGFDFLAPGSGVSLSFIDAYYRFLRQNLGLDD